MRRSITSLVRSVALAGPLALALAAGVAWGQPVGTQFTYQGQLNFNGIATNGGTADLRFRVYDAASGGAQQGGTLTSNNTSIGSDGRFTVELDFGSAAYGNAARYIEIDVRRPAGVGAFTTLSPRVRLSPTPNASFASIAEASNQAGNASNLNGQSGAFYRNASNLNAGTVPDAQLPAAVARTGNTQTFTGANTFNNVGNTFTGNGAGLTALSASNIAGGTLADARLSSNVALRSGGNTFTGAQTFNGGFVGVGRNFSVGAEQFGIGANAPGYNGMYVDNRDAGGVPFYGYSTLNRQAWTQYDGSSGDFSLYNNGRFQVIAKENGNLGVGGVNPLFNLHVTSNSDTQVALQSTSSGGRTWSLQSTTGTVAGATHLNAALQIIDRTGGVAQMTIGSNGKVSFANGNPPGSAKLNALSDSNSLDGVRGWTTVGTGWGVEGRASATNAIGVRGNLDSAGFTGAGVEGSATTTLAGAWAGRFFGNVTVSGAFSATSKAFRIDHPLDPANKELWHNSIESDQMINVYSGNVTTDATGYATISLPAWMEATNTNFRYQLTVVDEGEQQTDFVMARVVQKVAKNQFAIKTSAPNVEVSWQLTGERKDAWALKNPLQVEREKLEQNRGKYINPEAFGFGDEKRMEYTSRPDAAATEK